jgi:peptidoglycan/xylan/chitin deacetylase (PgdA/CDA1 family)
MSRRPVFSKTAWSRRRRGNRLSLSEMRLAMPQLPSTDVIVLCYHAVSKRWAGELAITPERLEAQLELLLDRGYRGATFHNAVTAPPAPRTVALTFDDGFRSVAEYGFPVLARLGVPATIFVVTEFVGSRGPMSWPGIDQWVSTADAGELEPISWDELRRLADAGWEIGSHTCTHPHLTRCDDATLAHELSDSRARCEERIGRPCLSLAYPFGDVDGRVARAAGDAGYVTACMLPSRLAPPAPLLWPRVGVWHEDSDIRFRMKISPTIRRLRRSPTWSGVETVRRSVRFAGSGRR